MDPSVGRIVHLHLDRFNPDTRLTTNGYNGPIPALITRVWERGIINVLAFPDNSFPVSLTSVHHTSIDEIGTRWDWPPIATPLSTPFVPIL